jgi:serine protease inhibitor
VRRMTRALAALSMFMIASSPSSSTKLGLDVYAKLRATPGNLALSPPSIRTALAVTSLGAASSTKQQLDKLLGADPSKPIGITTIAFADDIKPLPAFLDAAHDRFAATLATDPSSLPKRGALIKNDISFHGTWSHAFNDQATSTELFYPSAAVSERVSMMNLEYDLPAAHTKDADIVSLAYQDGSSFVVVVPRAKTGLSSIESKLGALLSTKLDDKPVRLSLPRFHIKSTSTLNTALASLGVKDAWCTPGAHPDFSALGTADGPICIDSVVHDATVDVDEKGTTASASTSVHLVAKEGEREGVLEVVADHPFAFAIVDAAGEIHFVGRVVDPGGDPALAPSPPHMKD